MNYGAWRAGGRFNLTWLTIMDTRLAHRGDLRVLAIRKADLRTKRALFDSRPRAEGPGAGSDLAIALLTTAADSQLDVFRPLRGFSMHRVSEIRDAKGL